MFVHLHFVTLDRLHDKSHVRTGERKAMYHCEFHCFNVVLQQVTESKRGGRDFPKVVLHWHQVEGDVHSHH